MPYPSPPAAPPRPAIETLPSTTSPHHISLNAQPCPDRFIGAEAFMSGGFPLASSTTRGAAKCRMSADNGMDTSAMSRRQALVRQPSAMPERLPSPQYKTLLLLLWVAPHDLVWNLTRSTTSSPWSALRPHLAKNKPPLNQPSSLPQGLTPAVLAAFGLASSPIAADAVRALFLPSLILAKVCVSSTQLQFSLPDTSSTDSSPYLRRSKILSWPALWMLMGTFSMLSSRAGISMRR